MATWDAVWGKYLKTRTHLRGAGDRSSDRPQLGDGSCKGMASQLSGQSGMACPPPELQGSLPRRSATRRSTQPESLHAALGERAKEDE
ncbi:hypothetical protein V8C86DRAFT_3102924 [Haematococcus lacustris]